ncbi:hypothetical protein BKA66DRAFT_448580 [Pyrenochaeta sp. MPI-SDFR-AT-0127]|nr:hypothetical protein BKA66DRAFT_448580 [Pyrenochaeta sp. MPI-SDFR-AT-0127]
MAKVVLRISPPRVLAAETATNTIAFTLAIRNRNWILAQALRAAQAPFSCDGDLSGELVAAGYGFSELVRIAIEAGGVFPMDGSLIVSMSAVQAAQKLYEWDEDEIDVFGCESCPRVRYVHALMKELSAFGIDINLQDFYRRSTAIQFAAERGIKDGTYLVALLDGGADPYMHRDNGFDSFYLVLFCGKLDNLAILVQYAIQDISHDHWLTNFSESLAQCHKATKSDSKVLLPRLVILEPMRPHGLIMLGSNVGSADYTGWTTFHKAVRTYRHQWSNLRWPVETTAPYSVTSSVPPDPDETLPTINTLHIAVGIYRARYETSHRVSPEIVRLLLENGMDPNAKAMHVGGLQNCSVWEDASPLRILFRSWNPSWGAEYPPSFFAVVQLLIDYCADVRDIANGLTIWQIANFEGYKSLWDTLRKTEPVSIEVD